MECMQLNGISQINTFMKQIEHNDPKPSTPSLFSFYTTSFEHMPATSISHFVYAEQFCESQFTKKKVVYFDGSTMLGDNCDQPYNTNR